MIVFCKIHFFTFFSSLLSSSSLGFPINAGGDHDACRCLGHTALRVDAAAAVSWTTSIQKLVTYVTLIMVILNILLYKFNQLREPKFFHDNNKRPLCREFSFSEMQTATKNFDKSMIIGKGGFGEVYRGVLDHGSMNIAVKRMGSKSTQGAEEFWTEIKMLSRFRHSHLVSLVGYCNEFNEMMVVYEYISGGNLGEYLHKFSRSSKKRPLFWVERVKICIGAARALDYLHTGTGVIHRDVKTSSILIDENMTTKLSDLGVSRICPINQLCTHVSTDVKGSFGYFDPNYFMTRRLTRKSDVYPFGVVLLEVLCGRPAVDPSLEDHEVGLVTWARRFIKNRTVNDIIDQVLVQKNDRI